MIFKNPNLFIDPFNYSCVGKIKRAAMNSSKVVHLLALIARIYYPVTSI